MSDVHKAIKTGLSIPVGSATTSALERHWPLALEPDVGLNGNYFRVAVLAEVDRVYPIHENEQYLVGFGGSPMPLIDVQVMEGVFSSEDKKLMIEKITQAFGEVAGKTLESGVSIRIHEIESGSWGTGGKAITTDDAKAWRAQG